ncbi:MAG: hypothetical protein GY764_02485, partial [Halieaceae bacterium]|nr:hypothetical protein [Halieaceae bacterium]
EVPTEKITGARNINIERHHQGAAANRDRLLADLPADVALHQMETADDVGRLLEAAGKVQDMGDDVRTHGTLAAQTDSPAKVKRILSDVFAADKSVMSNLTDVQLLAGRKMLGSLGEEVAELSNRIVAGSKEPQTLMEYQKKGEAFLALQSFLQGKVRETARALAQQKMIAETLESSNIANINDFMAQGTGLRTPEDIIRHATLTKNHIDKQGAEAGTVEGLKPQMRDYFKVGVEYWANNILSGVETHLVNLLGSPTVQLYEGLFIRPIAHGIGLARHTFDLGRPKPPGPHATLDEVERFNRGTVAWNERIKMQEHTSRLAGFTIGMRDGLTAFFDAIKTGKTQFGPEKGEEVRGAMHKVFGYHFGEKGEKAAALASGSFRALGAEDGFWKTNIFRSEFTALAARDAYAKNLDVDEHIEKVLSNPADFPELYEQAMSYSRKYTFTETDRPGILGDV